MTKRGFTLIELMMVVAVIGILMSIGIAQYRNMVIRSQEASTQGNLGTIRSALSIYYGDNENVYPMDDLSSLIANQKYLPLMPFAMLPPNHAKSNTVTPEVTPTDSGAWSYDNDNADTAWGTVRVGCLHADSHGTLWTTY